MLVFLGATVMVILAEMGDKTQLLAMAFATRFPAKSVFWGVLIATLLNHALAVALGTYLGSSFDLQLVQIIAAASFILFGLWTIRGDTLDGEDKRKTAYGPIITVAIAFFIAEMGDKTQLATVALAAKYNSPIATLLGSTTGLIIADVIGILIGVIAGKKIPERAVKWISAMIFIAFGYLGLFTSVPAQYLSWPYVLGLVAFTGIGIVVAVRK